MKLIPRLKQSYIDARFLSARQNDLNRGIGLNVLTEENNRYENKMSVDVISRFSLIDHKENRSFWKVIIRSVLVWLVFETIRIITTFAYVLNGITDPLYFSLGFFGDFILIWLIACALYLRDYLRRLLNEFTDETNDTTIKAPISFADVKEGTMEKNCREYNASFLQKSLLPILRRSYNLTFSWRYILFWAVIGGVISLGGMWRAYGFFFPYNVNPGIPNILWNIDNWYGAFVGTLIWAFVGAFLWVGVMSILTVGGLFQWRVLDFRPELGLRIRFANHTRGMEAVVYIISISLAWILIILVAMNFANPGGVPTPPFGHTFVEAVTVLTILPLILAIGFLVYSIHVGMKKSKIRKLAILDQKASLLESEGKSEELTEKYRFTLGQMKEVSSLGEWPIKVSNVFAYLIPFLPPLLSFLATVGLLH